MSASIRIQPQRLVLIGSVLVDILMYIDRLPERGGDTLAQNSRLTSGGGFNTLIGAQRLGLSAAYAGRVGDGPMGTQVIADLTEAQIPLLLPLVQGEDTGFDVALVEQDAERTFVTAPGTESRLQRADLQMIPLQAGDAVYVSGYELCYPISGAALEEWLPTLASDILLVVDPGPLVAEISLVRLASVLARTDILSLNAREARLLTNNAQPAEAAQALVARLSSASWVVVRDGARGCWIANSSTQTAQHIAPRPTSQAVDSTGAGDAHVAALLVRLGAGEDFASAAYIANVAASLSVEKIGPATGPTMQELTTALSV